MAKGALRIVSAAGCHPQPQLAGLPLWCQPGMTQLHVCSLLKKVGAQAPLHLVYLRAMTWGKHHTVQTTVCRRLATGSRWALHGHASRDRLSARAAARNAHEQGPARDHGPWLARCVNKGMAGWGVVVLRPVVLWTVCLNPSMKQRTRHMAQCCADAVGGWLWRTLGGAWYVRQRRGITVHANCTGKWWTSLKTPLKLANPTCGSNGVQHVVASGMCCQGHGAANLDMSVCQSPQGGAAVGRKVSWLAVAPASG